MKNLMLKLATFALVGTLFAPLALADHDRGRRYDRRVGFAADEVEAAARSLNARAEQFLVRGRVDRFEEQALISLRDLERRAERFRRMTDRRFVDRRDLERDFFVLRRTYFAAENDLERLRGQGRVQREWLRMRDAMEDLSRVVTGERLYEERHARERAVPLPPLPPAPPVTRPDRPRISISINLPF